MKHEFLTELYPSMGMVVLKRETVKQYRRMTQAPDWYFNILCLREHESNLLDEKFANAFLENFLIDAELFWDEKQGCEEFINSGVWSEKSQSGEEVFFEARAQVHRGELVLVIRKLNEEFYTHKQQIQTARENMLANERLEEEVRRRTADIRRREEEIILRLLAVSGARDGETGAHIRRIGLYSGVIAKALGWSDRAVDDLRLAAPMHDIGKVGIPDSVLFKPGKLSPSEWSIMQTHPVIGARMIGDSDIPVLKQAAEISLYHHERYDGKGYPHGLKGEEIPECARIVAIVDVYDALIHKRVYKEAFEEDIVGEMMLAQVGKHFDPYLFGVFLNCLDEIREICRNNQDVPLALGQKSDLSAFTENP